MISMGTEELDPAIDTKSVKMRSPPGPEQLLPLAVSRPRDALIAARAVLADRPGSYDASLAHQATGIVLRDRGDLPLRVGAAQIKQLAFHLGECEVHGPLTLWRTAFFFD